MQQTETYKLNLIEPTDPFLPDGLNQNTQKIEDAMIAHEAAVAEQVDGLDARVAVFEAKHLAYGTLVGQAVGTVHIDLPFRPKWVVLLCVSRISTSPLISVDVPNGHHYYLPIDDDGFGVKDYGSDTFGYIAFA